MKKKTNEMKNLKREFQKDMFRIYTEASELGYNPTRFLQMVHEHGGVETAKRLLSTDDFIQDGIKRLWELGRLDLSVEWLVLQDKYKDLFTEQELEIAKRRLKLLNYDINKNLCRQKY